jgi:hypothetical protein
LSQIFIRSDSVTFFQQVLVLEIDRGRWRDEMKDGEMEM